MRIYKLWLEIEECDVETGEYRNLSEVGEAEPIPVAIFASLQEARVYAEALAMDGSGAGRPHLQFLETIN